MVTQFEHLTSYISTDKTLKLHAMTKTMLRVQWILAVNVAHMLFLVCLFVCLFVSVFCVCVFVCLLAHFRLTDAHFRVCKLRAICASVFFHVGPYVRQYSFGARIYH